MYSFSSASRLAPTLLQPLSPLLIRICDALPSADDRLAAAAAVLRAAASGLVHVLLDGGLRRVCRQDEAEALHSDLRALRAFFTAAGEGLLPEDVAAALGELEEVVEAMGLDTHALIALYEKSVADKTRATMGRIVGKRAGVSFGLDALGGAGPGSGGEEGEARAEVLLRILCHRGDWTARTFLKRRKVPKAVSSGQEWLLRQFLFLKPQ